MIVHCHRQMSYTHTYTSVFLIFLTISLYIGVKEREKKCEDSPRQKRQIEAPRQHKRTKKTYSIAARASSFLSVSNREKTNLQQHGKRIA
jgi:hypothetical protein